MAACRTHGTPDSPVQVLHTYDPVTLARSAVTVVNRSARRLRYTEAGPGGVTFAHLAHPHSNTVRHDAPAMTLRAATFGDDGILGAPTLPPGWTLTLTEG
jgi:hypothetical protein